MTGRFNYFNRKNFLKKTELRVFKNQNKIQFNKYISITSGKNHFSGLMFKYIPPSGLNSCPVGSNFKGIIEFFDGVTKKF